MGYMKALYTKTLLLFLLLNFLGARDLRADHALAGEITYQWLGGNTYKVTFKLFRDCSGVDAAVQYLRVRSASSGLTLNVAMSGPFLKGEVTNVCPATATTCDGGAALGVEEYHYEATVNLPAACPDWIFSAQVASRNRSTNIQPTPVQSLYVWATLNNTAGGNNSPVFSNPPTPFTCANQYYCFSSGAIDPEGDVLTYTMISAKSSATNDCIYMAPFTASSPIASSSGINLNPSTGDLCITPNMLGSFVITVRVDELRGGVLIGSVVRDMQFAIINCANILPSLDGINGTGVYTATCPEGSPFCFTTNSSDPDVPQNVTMSWNAAIPGATFSVSAGARPTGTFCWTPSAADVANNPHCFSVKVQDDACIYNGIQVRAYCITVNMAVPLELLTFTARKEDAGVVLSWQVSQSIKGEQFIVERSLDGRSFEAIAALSGTEEKYTYTDPAVRQDICYYRLLQTDTEGNARRSAVLMIKNHTQQKFTITGLLPNPCTDRISLSYLLSEDSPLSLELYNSTGARIYSRTIEGRSPGSHSEEIRLSDSEEGIYFVRLVSPEYSEIKRILVIK
jgi:hypothetical protein